MQYNYKINNNQFTIEKQVKFKCRVPYITVVYRVNSNFLGRENMKLIQFNLVKCLSTVIMISTGKLINHNNFSNVEQLINFLNDSIGGI